MPDTKPQRESETDYTREETYVDALMLDLQHGVTDVFVPLASDQLTLEVRRTLMQAAYPIERIESNVDSVYEIQEKLKYANTGLLDSSQAFGVCWRSGLDCGLKIVTAYSFREGLTVIGEGYRQVVVVTDENGQAYRFGVLSDGTFLPLPSASVSIDVADISLTKNGGNFVFKRRYGNTIIFNASPIGFEGALPFKMNADGSVTVDDDFYYPVAVTNGIPRSLPVNFEYREYYRPSYVQDRYGNKLVYSFSGDSRIPCEIKALNSTQSTNAVSDQKITITVESGLVRLVTDPLGRTVCYDYGYSGSTIRAPNGLPLLGSVTRGSTVLASYSYDEQVLHKWTGYYDWGWEWSNAEDSDSDSGAGEYYTDYHHLVLKSVTDANTNQYNFVWKENSTRGIERWIDENSSALLQRPTDIDTLLSSSGWIEAGDSAASPLQISEVRQGTNVANFRVIQPITLAGPRLLGIGAQRTRVTDMGGTVWTNEFTAAAVAPSLDRPALGTMENEGLSVNASDAVLFQTMLVYDQKGGYETFSFNTNAGMALQKATDYFGNPTAFSQGDVAVYTNLGANENAAIAAASLAHYLRRPTAQTNALLKSRAYAYGSYNQKKKIADEFTRNTEFEFDLRGNRTKATVKDRNGNTVSVTEMEYTSAAFPNFMTKKTVKKMSGAGDPSWVADQVTEFEPHNYGQVGRKIVDRYGLNLVTVYDYDKNNNCTNVIDPNGNKTVNSYDSHNRLIDIAFFEGATTLKSTKHFWYDPRGNKTWEKDENGNYSYFEYDSRNNRTKTVRIMGGTSSPDNGYTVHADDIVTTSEYNAMGGLAATVDASGLRTEFQYDHIQRLTNTIAGANLPAEQRQITAYGYDADNCGSLLFDSSGFKPATVTDPRGYVTTTTYDSLHRPVEVRSQVTNGVETVTQNTYDDVGNLTEVRKKVGGDVWQVTTTIYDEQDRPVKVINPDGTETETVYTSTGLKWKVIDELNRVSTVEYDAAGRPVKTIAPITSVVTETGYDLNSNVQWVKDANGNVSTNVYDFRNRLVQTISPLVPVYDSMLQAPSPMHAIVSIAYDASTNVVSVTDAKGNTTTNFYDKAGRLVVTIAPEVLVYDSTLQAPSPMHPVTSNFYDKAGHIIATTDANGRTVQMQYDAFGRLTNTVDAVGNTISFAYDKSGNQIALTDGNTNRTEFVYDGLNRKISTIYPGGTHEDAVYDLVGNRISRKDAKAQTTDYFYDLRNRLTNVVYGADASAPRTRDYVYNAAGNLLSVVESDPSDMSDVSYTYDSLNRVVSETSAGVTHQYRYDLQGNRTQAVYGVTGRTNSWTYDTLNRITQITDNGSPDSNYELRNTYYAYDLNSKPVYRQYPTGVEEFRTFDAMGRLLSMTTTNSANGESFAMDYQYDGVGSAREMIQTSENLAGKAQDTVTKWAYDNRYRLTNETVVTGSGGASSTSTVSYVWDHADNRLSKTVYSNAVLVSSTVYTNNALNQMLGYTEISGGASSTSTVSFAYDPNGARTNKTVTGGSVTTNDAMAPATFVTIGHPGNAADTTGYGAVDYTYQISATEVTIAEFAASGAGNGNENWWNDPAGQGTSAGSNAPAGAVSLYEAMRYCNWLTSGDVNLGAYRFSDGVYQSTDRASAVATYGTVYAVPTEDEWYKAAYFKPDASGYSLYANGTDIEPIVGTADGWSYNNAVGSPNYVWEVGCGGVEQNGTYNMMGNVWEWMENSDGLFRGGYYEHVAYTLSSAFRASYNPGDEHYAIGFRVVAIGGALSSNTVYTTYVYDEDNRLVSVAEGLDLGSPTHTFSYDYRSRRYFRSTPTETNLCVFDGGLTVQEYNTSGSPLAPPSLATLSTEYIRGEGMGGGVGGMVYSIKHPAPGSQLPASIICSHANHRGDVIARSDSNGSLTSFSRYEAYGTRPYEWGNDPDRQKANTKEEEKSLGLLIEGMRIRNLYDGTFMTRDPIGYKDGPNIYCYVHGNPITKFDPLGLRAYGNDYKGKLTKWDWIDKGRKQDAVQKIYDRLNQRDAVVYCPGLGNTASDRKTNAEILSKILGIEVISTVENPTFKAGGEAVGKLGDKLGAGSLSNPLRAPGNLIGLAGNIFSRAGVALDVGVAGVQKMPGGKVLDPAFHNAQGKFSAAENKTAQTGGNVLVFMHSEGGIYGENAMTENQRSSFTVHTLGSGGYAGGFKDVQDVTHHVNQNLNGRLDFVPAIAGGIDFGKNVKVEKYTVSSGSRIDIHSFENYANQALMKVGKEYYNENK